MSASAFHNKTSAYRIIGQFLELDIKGGNRWKTGIYGNLQPLSNSNYNRRIAADVQRHYHKSNQSGIYMGGRPMRKYDLCGDQKHGSIISGSHNICVIKIIELWQAIPIGFE